MFADSKPQNTAKGRTPIEKNIIVVDEQGNDYEATYPKRAKGLVKNGRARFIGSNKICLTARPPNKNLEDRIMNDYTLPQRPETYPPQSDTYPRPEKHPQPEVPKTSWAETAEYSVTGILKRIDSIIKDTAHIHKALESISEIPLQGGKDDYSAANKAESVSNIVWARETTNQQLIKLLEKMYDNLTPYRESEDIVKLRAVVPIIESLQSFADYLEADSLAEIIQDIMRQMFAKQFGAKPPFADFNTNGNWNSEKAPNGKKGWFGGKPPRTPKAPNNGDILEDSLRKLVEKMCGSGVPNIREDGAGEAEDE